MSHAVETSSIRDGSGDSSGKVASNLFGTMNLESDPCVVAVSPSGESLAEGFRDFFCDADDMDISVAAASLEGEAVAGRFRGCSCEEGECLKNFIVRRRSWSLSRNTSRALFMVRFWSCLHACDTETSWSVQSLRRLFWLMGPFIASSFQALHDLSHAWTFGHAAFSPAQVNASSVCWSGSGNIA